MYDEHYGFTGRPFQLTPDPKFWFDTISHRKAMSYLGYGLSQGEGFIVITGDVGTGKTTLVGHLTEKLDRELLHVVKVASTQIEPEDLLRIVAVGLGESISGATKAELLATIEHGLHAVARSGRRTLLIVDEAQALPVTALEELRMLSNISAGGHALLQIFLLGQPEFRERLQGADRLEQLRQRVIALHHLEPMEAAEVEPYMAHRLNLVGWDGRPRFTGAAFDALHRGSAGVPRLLNQLAGRVLLHGAIEQLETIDADAVDAVIADIHRDLPQPRVAAAPALVVEPAPEPVQLHVAAAPEPEAAPSPLPGALRDPEPVNAEHADTPADPEPRSDSDSDRIAAIEARLADQDATLRRLLTLMVDFVENGRGAAPVPLRGVGMNAPAAFPAMQTGTEVLNGMSVDVEEAFQVGAFEGTILRSAWDGLESRVVRNTERCLELFAEAEVKATFFTLGWVAQRHPELMRRIVADGHELASHGWDHQRVFLMSREQFREDLKRTRGVLEDAGGMAVRGYRAPSFSIDARTPWAHEELALAGYTYSSSVAPIRHDHYGWPQSPRFGWRPFADDAFIEIPVSVAQFGQRRLATGGGFFRLLPAALTDHAVRQCNRQGQPAAFYFHPWEIDPDQPRVPGAPLRSRLRHYSRLGAMHGKLAGLLRRHRWGRMDAVVANAPA